MNPLIPDAELRDLFQAECEEHLQELDRGLLHLEKSPGDRSVLEDVFRRVHSLKGSARMLGVGAVETVAHRFEDVLGAARSNRTRLTAEIADRLYQGLDAIRQLVHEAVTGAPSGVRVPEVLARLSVTAQGPGTAPPATPPREHRVAPADVPDPAAAPSPASSLPPVPATPSARHDSPPAARSDSLASDSGQPIAEAKTMPAAGPPDTAPSAAFSIDTVRVKPQQLDTLMTLAGELAVTKIQLARRARDLEELVNYWEEWNREAAGKGARPAGSPAGGVSPDRYALDDGLAAVRTRERLERLGVLLGDLLRRVHDDDNRLESVADRIDGSVRTMRLLPLKRIFHLFPRMMRDLARQYDKEVEFVIEGEDVPADKRLLEELKDPLMHLLRNSLDHGLESPADREHRGKPRQGTVRLRAWQTATNVCIEVRDDGRGLDLEAIKRTALQKKLCGPEIEQWSPGQIQHLIFAPGFSTAQYITDVSGRGVGLDVVRANVERLKGVISIESAPGRGCAFRLELPISLSTIRVLIVQVQRLKV
ncbi:MAG: hybrid sensor histidine kinase/response regulator, partial [Verrucomicrobia bacterium]|nr:hybrid sensor histidine kinase/response regulator [Verrucomicrobiota bacterium]